MKRKIIVGRLVTVIIIIICIVCFIIRGLEVIYAKKSNEKETNTPNNMTGFYDKKGREIEIPQAKIDSTETFISNLSTEEMFTGFSIYKDDALKKMYELDDIFLPRGVVFIKENSNTKEYEEIAIIKCEREEDEDKVLLKLIARYEKLKNEAGSTYGNAILDVDNISIKRLDGTSVFILSQDRRSFEELIYNNYINF